MKLNDQQEKRQRVHLFHNHLMQVALDRDTYEDAELVRITAQPQTFLRWDEMALRQRVVAR
jgi:hypothetical protein